ncbi:ribonuclease H [Sesbania bispinosa]|nr:ribonuclease H [Sesbania bispinosa]
MNGNFIWGNRGTLKLAYCAWDKFCRPKDYGGIGLRILHAFNLDMFMKLGRGLLTKSEALWVRVLKSKKEHPGWLVMGGLLVFGLSPSYRLGALCSVVAVRQILKTSKAAPKFETHIIRDCNLVRRVWPRNLHPSRAPSFFTGWVKANVDGSICGGDASFHLVVGQFGTTWVLGSLTLPTIWELPLYLERNSRA